MDKTLEDLDLEYLFGSLSSNIKEGLKIFEEINNSDGDKKMDKILDFDLEDLFDSLSTNVKEDLKTFEDLINLDGGLSREVYLGDIEGGVGSTVEGYIRFWNKYDERKNIPVEEREPIKLYIDSNGGYLDDTLTIIDAIKLSKTPVWTICTGTAYSGGFFSFISGHKRIAYPHSTFLFHEGATGNSGTSGQFENYSTFYKRQLECLKDIVLKNTNITEEEYQKIKRDDVWYFVEDGIEKGFIDEIAEEFI